MTHLTPASDRSSMLGHFLQILRTATLERMVLPDVEGREIDERILLESHLAWTAPLPSVGPRPPVR